MRKKTQPKFKSRKLIALPFLALVILLAADVLAEPAGQYIGDAAVTAKVKAELIADKTLDATNITVNTTEGIAQLSGTVGSHNQETEAVRVASGVSGVKSVKNSLTVK